MKSSSGLLHSEANLHLKLMQIINQLYSNKKKKFKFNLSIISFINHAFNVVSKKSSPNPRSPRFSLVLSLRNFTVLHLCL